MVLVLTDRDSKKSKDKHDMIAFDIASGDVLWESEFPDNVDLHAVGARTFITRFDLNGHQPPVADADSIYLTYAGLHRYDLATGHVKWISEDFGAAVAQMIVHGNRVYGCMGGSFFDWDKKEWLLKKPHLRAHENRGEQRKDRGVD
jgi:outer membrane protein assembly factor BamB